MTTPTTPATGAAAPPSPDAELHCLMYVSSASRRFGTPELADMLTRAREKNHRLGVTGMLLYKAGLFLQVLEGESARVRDLYETIAGDPRHRACSIVQEGAIPRRQFSEWSMAFRNLDDAAVRSLPGYSPFMENPRLFAEISDDPTGCWALLRVFREEL